MILISDPCLPWSCRYQVGQSGAAKLLGAGVRKWPMSEVAARLVDVRSMGHSGLDLLTASFSHFDPERTGVTRIFEHRSYVPRELLRTRPNLPPEAASFGTR